MKKFNLDTDVIYTNSSIGEHIRFASSSLSRRTAATKVTESSPWIKSFVHWNDPPFSGGFYQTVYDRDYHSPAAIPLVDVCFGLTLSSSFLTDVELNQNGEYIKQKNRNYRLYSQILLGNANKIFQINGQEQHELMFINIRRNQFKDSIAPNSLKLNVIYSGNVQSFRETRIFTDSKVEQTHAGLRGEIKPSVFGFGTGNTLTGSEFNKVAGYVYYQAGILVLVPHIISNTSGNMGSGNFWWMSGTESASYSRLATTATGSGAVLENLYSAARQRIFQIDFRNVSSVRTTFYTCTAERNEFNYSSNPSFKDHEGLIIPTSGANGSFETRTYITKVALLGSNSEVIAVGNLSRPVRKDPFLKVEVKVRLDY